jgi:acyl-CoA synthetase (AMP-forming)/AMP-acid ligase II
MLPQTTSEAARRFGDATAYVTADGWPITYRDLDSVSDEVAAGLLRRGVTPGSVVGLELPPGPEYLFGYLGTAKIGAIAAGVNTRFTSSERKAVLEVAEPALTIADPAASSLDGVLADYREAGKAPQPLPPDPDRAVAIIFTSGTTGNPKGALYTNRQLEFITRTDVGDTWGGGTRTLTGTSFAHLGFMTKLPGALRRGGTTFIMTRWTAEGALELLTRERMNSVAGVPTQLALMLRHPRFDEFDFASLRAIIAGGGPVTPGLAEEARRRFGAALSTRYSCTEAGIGLGTGFDDPPEDAVVSVGRPHPSVDLGVLDEDDRAVEVGEVGSVCLRSPAVMSGYWRDAAATEAAFTRDGFVRTGDLGWVDDVGRLRLVGRSKEMYVRGGYNVYPVEVEGVLSTHPEVAAVAVVPRPDPVMGEIGVAVIVPTADRAPSLDGLRAFARDRLASYKLPEAIVAVDGLPLTAGDKVDRRALRARLSDGDATAPALRPDGDVR